MSLFRRSRYNNRAAHQQLRCKSLRLESLEKKIPLAGDVTATLVGGDLILVGDIDDNSVQVVRDGSLAMPGVGDVSVNGLAGTTVNGMASESFTVTGDVIFDYTAGGNNIATVGEPMALNPDALELPGNVSVEGGAGDEFLNVQNSIINGSASLSDSIGGVGANLSVTDSLVTGDVSNSNISDYSDIGLQTSTVNGDVTLTANGTDLLQAVLDFRSSSIGDDVRVESNADLVETRFRGISVGDDVIHISGDGDDLIDFGADSNDVGNTIGDDLRLLTGGGNDEVLLAGYNVGDDLVFNGGDGDDIFETEALDDVNVVGDDVYLSGKAGNDTLFIADTEIGDKLRISGNSGDDFAGGEGLVVGRSALVSLGSGIDEADFTDVTGARSLTVLGRGENTIILNDITTSHFVTVLTSNGADSVSMFNVNTYSAMVATCSGNDDVAIVDSAFDYLFVFLGGGDDTLTLEGVTVDRFAVLSGGSGAGDELIDDGDNDINFAIDFAFESGSI